MPSVSQIQCRKGMEGGNHWAEAFNPHGTQDICEFLEIVPVPAEKARALMGFSVRF